MLKNLNPHLNADLLHVLRSMGHGDELILADCNFPSDSVAAHTVSGKLIRMEGLNIPEVAEAILSVYPWTVLSRNQFYGWRWLEIRMNGWNATMI